MYVEYFRYWNGDSKLDPTRPLPNPNSNVSVFFSRNLGENELTMIPDVSKNENLEVLLV
jgi:hypothetical protein